MLYYSMRFFFVSGGVLGRVEWILGILQTSIRCSPRLCKGKCSDPKPLPTDVKFYKNLNTGALQEIKLSIAINHDT